jgi:hypothetical protein
MHEAKIGRSPFQASLGKKFTRPHLNIKKVDVVVCACHPSYRGKYKIKRSRSGLAWAKSKTPSPK